MNKIHSIFSLITATSLCLSIQCFSSNAVIAQKTSDSKITLELQDALAELDNDDSVPICIWINDIDYDTIKDITLNNTGLSEEIIMNSSYELYKQLSDNDIQNKEEKTALGVFESINAFYDANKSEIKKLSLDVDTYISEKRAVAKDEYDRQNKEFADKYLKGAKIEFISSYAPMIIGETTKETINKLEDNEIVDTISLYTNVECYDHGNIDVGVASIEGDYVRDTLGYKGDGVKVGQIESGRPQTGITELVDTDITRGGTNNNTYHASLVAAIIAGSTGMAPKAKLYSTTVDNFYQNTEWLISSGVTVINRSNGSDNYGTYDNTAKWVDHVVNQHNVSWVQSSGNSGPNGYVGSPGNALTELLVCGECGTAYRRCRWTSHNRDRTVWRCINRLEYGPKYCKSPTIDEEPLHNAIMRAINEFYNCGDDVAKVLKSATDAVLSGSNDDEIKQIEQRLNDIDQARNDFVNLIATGACATDSLDDEFARLYSEEEKLSQKLLSLKAQRETEQNELADDIKAVIDKSSFELQQYDDVLVRKVIECVKILSKEEISVTFKGGYEIKSELLT